MRYVLWIMRYAYPVSRIPTPRLNCRAILGCWLHNPLGLNPWSLFTLVALLI